MPSARDPGVTNAYHYHNVEPHPDAVSRVSSVSTSKSTSSYIYTGRGGAGNAVKVAPPTSFTYSANSTGPASCASLPHTQNNATRIGRGGAGNVIHRVRSEKRMFSFDEELQAQMARERHIAPIYHVGRGGAGNTVLPYGDGIARRRTSEATTDSEGSDGSASAPRNIVKNGLKKSWKKVAGVGSYMT